MAKYTREEVEAMLSNGIYKVTFKNKAGELRTITCTRDFDLLNDEDVSEDLEFIAPHGGVCYNTLIKVWAIDSFDKDGYFSHNINNWRSFAADKVESIEEYLEEEV